jgi:tetratricopeptide (TPR) repeat protein
MRLLSRLGSWLRADPDARSGAVEVESVTLTAQGTGKRAPATSPEQFRDALLDAIERAHAAGSPDVYPLDPAVQMLVIPALYDGTDEDERRLGMELDAAIRRVQSAGRSLSSLTWSALRDARPSFEPSYVEWAGERAHRFEGEVGIIFFVDVEAIALSMAQAAQSLGFGARVHPDQPSVMVTDGRFEAHVGVHALVAESLWTARGPLSTIRRRARSLAGEFRGYLAAQQGLVRRFPGVRFAVKDGALYGRGQGVEGKVSYRALTAAIKHAGLGVDRWLARVVLADVCGAKGDAGVIVRSPAYLKAWPDALSQTRDGYTLVAVRVDDGRVRPVLRSDDDPPERFDHYLNEAERQLGFLKFNGHAFIVREGEEAAACLVGDAMATLSFSPSLVRGAIEQLIPLPERVRVRSVSEDLLVVGDADSTSGVIEAALAQAAQLEEDLCDDRADRVALDMELPVDTRPAGHFELELVPSEYFDLCKEAERSIELDASQSSYQRGLALETIGRNEHAIHVYQRALRADTEDGELNFALGRCLNALGQHERAVPLLQRAHDALPERAEAANALGLALYLSGDSFGASEAFESAVQLDPAESSYFVNLARSYVDDQRVQHARLALERALDIDPGCADAHASLALLCHQSGDHLRALHHAREALAEEPENAVMKRLLNALELDDE